MNFLQSAIEYHQSGLKVIPFWNEADGKKRFPADYARYREAQTESDIRRLFSPDCSGVCLLCTDGIEAVDVDTKHDSKGTIAEDILQAIEDFGFTMPCLIQRTKSGGFHFIYRCPNPEGNTKLATRRGEKEAMIETRGKGGLLFVAPTPGYEFVNGRLSDLPTLDATQDQRDNLMRLCRHFNEVEPEAYEKKVNPSGAALAGEKPWEAYDQATDVQTLMEGYGWKVINRRGDYVRLNRPGAKHIRGVDGTVIVSHNLFYPFTSSEQFAPNKAYSPSAVYAIMEHRGNFSDAAKALYKQGFGDRIEQAQQQEAKAKLPELISLAEGSRFDIRRQAAEPKTLLRFEGERTQPIGGRGMIGVFTGHEKSGKSFVCSCIAAAALGGHPEILNFSLDLDGGKMLWFDTEQSGFFFQKTQQRIFRQAGLSENVGFYAAYHLRKMAAAERLEVVEHFVYNTPGLSVVVIDGFVDLIGDYNDLKSVQEYVGRLMKWSDEKQVLILGVLHVNKGDGKIRGHIGSELKNKCDFIINAAKTDSELYTVSNPTSRYAPFKDFDFTRDQDGLPVYESHYNRTFGKPHSSNQFPVSAPAFSSALPQGAGRTEDVPF